MPPSKRKRSPSPSFELGPCPKRSSGHMEGLPSLQSLEDDLQIAANKVIPSPQPIYTKVVLITIEWSDTDIPLDTCRALATTMKYWYDFKYEKYVIDSKNPFQESAFAIHQAIHAYRMQYVNTHSDRVLFIVYFTGHVFQRPNSGDIMISGKSGPKDPFFAWKNVAGACHNNTWTSYLHIMDCCNAAMTHLHRNSRC